MRTLVIRGGRLIDPRSGVDAPRDVLVRDGVIAGVAEQISAPDGAEIVEARGRWVVPGLIDLHVHLREPGEEGKETILTGSRAAVAGGFTAVVAMPNTKLVNDSALVTRLIRERAAQADLCRVYPAGAITKGLLGQELSEFGELVGSGCVCITDDGKPVMSAGLMRRALQYSRLFGVPVMVHEEDLTLSAGGAMNEGPTATRLGLRAIPSSAEVAMVARDLVLLEENGGHLHIAHLSCEGSVRLVRDARARGLNVTAEVTPHHFTLPDEAVGDYDTHAKMAPPLRSRRDIEAVREGLVDGTIEAIATDHAPHGVLDKHVEFDKAMNGIIGLETSLPLTLALVRAGVLDAKTAVARLSEGPARIFKLAGGHLGVGAPADVTVIDPDAEYVVDRQRFFSKSRNSPFHGWKMTGRATHTVVGGRVVYAEGSIRQRPEGSGR